MTHTNTTNKIWGMVNPKKLYLRNFLALEELNAKKLSSVGGRKSCGVSEEEKAVQYRRKKKLSSIGGRKKLSSIGVNSRICWGIFPLATSTTQGTLGHPLWGILGHPLSGYPQRPTLGVSHSGYTVRAVM